MRSVVFVTRHEDLARFGTGLEREAFTASVMTPAELAAGDVESDADAAVLDLKQHPVSGALYAVEWLLRPAAPQAGAVALYLVLKALDFLLARRDSGGVLTFEGRVEMFLFLEQHVAVVAGGFDQFFFREAHSGCGGKGAFVAGSLVKLHLQQGGYGAFEFEVIEARQVVFFNGVGQEFEAALVQPLCGKQCLGGNHVQF